MREWRMSIAKAKTIKDDNGDKVDVMYTYTDPTSEEEETFVTGIPLYEVPQI